MINKIFFHKTGSKILDTQKWFTNLRLTKMVPKIETQRNELQNLVGQNWFTNFRITKSRLTKIIHKIETHKNDSQDWDSQK